MPRSALIRSIALSALFVPIASAQTRRAHERSLPGDELGSSLASIGDLDGDSVPDFLVGAPGSRTGRPGYVEVRSGADGHVLYRADGTRANDRFGITLAVIGDFDHDERNDFAVGAVHLPDESEPPVDGYVRLLAGADGRLLRELRSSGASGGRENEEFGLALCGTPDLDGDGVPDVVVGTPSLHGRAETVGGRVEAFSGADGIPFLSITSAKSFGSAISPMADQDGDGLADIAIGQPWGGPDESGYAIIHGACPDGPIPSVSGSTRGEGFGGVLVGGGDFDRDGRDDLIVGAFSSNRATDRLICVSGANRSCLFVLRLGEETPPGASVALANDWNADGVVDFVVGNPLSQHVRVFSGADRSALDEIRANGEEDSFGLAVLVPGDFDGDSKPDLIVGSPFWTDSGFACAAAVGRITAYSGATGLELYTRCGRR